MDVRIGLMLKRLLRTLPRPFPVASGTRARLAPVGTMSPAGVRAARIATFQRQGSAAALAGLASLIVKIHPQAGGSGLPEVKETLVGVLDSNPNRSPEHPSPYPDPRPSATPNQAGIVLFDSFSLMTLGLKMLALALAIASGLSIGKE